MWNWFKSAILLAALSYLLIWLGNMIGGATGVTFALLFSLIMNIGALFVGHKIVLAMYGARELTPEEAPGLFDMVRELTQRANLPMPKLYLIPSDVPNAFATGPSPSNAHVAVTEGLLQMLTPEETMAVLAHELGHVKHRDILISTVVSVIGSAVMYVAYMLRWVAFFGGSDEDENPLALLAISILAPFVALLIQLAISRSREYLADDFSAKLMGTPDPLISALIKLHERAANPYVARPLNTSPATSHLFIAPVDIGRFLGGLFSTHPTLEDRIENLKRHYR